MEQMLICLSIALIAGLLMSRLAKAVNLPAVTSYLVAGLLLGPFVLGRLGLSGLGIGFGSLEQVEGYGVVTQVALGFIAFVIGNEFRLSSLRSMGQQAITVGIAQAVITTALVDVQDYTHFAVLGSTRDDAAGECFDKVARVLGIGYPGGAPMDRLADGGDDTKYELPRAHVQGAELDMSFSGLKTACLNLIHNAQQKGDALDLPSFAASFGRAVSESLVPRAMEASRRKGYGRLAVAGGVAANRRIRADLEAACRQSGDRLFLPELKYCGDNAAMIGCQGYYEFLAGRTAGLDLNAYATRDISLG